MKVETHISIILDNFKIPQDKILELKVKDVAKIYRDIKDQILKESELKINYLRSTYKGDPDDLEDLLEVTEDQYLDKIADLDKNYELLKAFLSKIQKSNEKENEAEDDIKNLFPEDLSLKLTYIHIKRDFPIPAEYKGQGLAYNLVDGNISKQLILPPTVKNKDVLFFFQPEGDILLELKIIYKQGGKIN